MKRTDQDRVMTVLAEAVELPPAERARFLDSTCTGEPELRREVEELLACADPAAAVFDAAAQHIVQPDPDRIGPYEILEPIGEGGMAVVYKAHQHHPVRRTVALKLIKLGMDTRQFIARFESERQVLALMDHPNVARVYDAGSTDTGRPYFVMEYVAGEPLLEYCDARQLDLRQRLSLFIVICEAIEHAHRKGIIHRDLKNSNVLVAEVDDRAAPKVIDFGVAKAIQQPLAERVLQTEEGQMLGTPEYMSPEQAERGGIDVDTRADVYSLGVLLYELIAGVQPIGSDLLRRGSYEQVQRVIRETEPSRPSTRLSILGGADAVEIARRRSTALPTLIRNLRSELEWIPLKAMRKDREQRYRSAGELADDVCNYLDGQPLIAGPETPGYKLGKFLRRHKAGVAASVAMILLLVGGIVATTWQAVRASRAEARALAERDNARATLEFLTDDMLSGATPDRIPDVRVRDTIIAAMITPAAERVGERFRDQPLIEASIRSAIQTVLRDIGRGDLALPHAEAAVAIRRRLLGPDDPDTIASLNDLGRVLRATGRYAEAEPVYREALERRRRVLGEDHPDTLSSLNNYAGALERLGRAAEAEPLFKQVLERRRRLLGDDDPSTIMSINNYAHVLNELGRLTEAEQFSLEALERRRRVNGPDHPLTLLAMNNYADELMSLGRLAEAEPLARQALEGYRRVYGPDDNRTITALANYGSVLSELDREEETLELYQQSLDQRRRLFGEDHPDTLWSMILVGASLTRLERADEAEPLLRDAWERSRRIRGEDHRGTVMALNNYVVALFTLGRLSEAEPLSRQALSLACANPSLGPSHGLTNACASVRHRILLEQGRHSEAATLRREFSLPGDSTTQSTTGPS